MESLRITAPKGQDLTSPGRQPRVAQARHPEPRRAGPVPVPLCPHRRTRSCQPQDAQVGPSGLTEVGGGSPVSGSSGSGPGPSRSAKRRFSPSIPTPGRSGSRSRWPHGRQGHASLSVRALRQFVESYRTAAEKLWARDPAPSFQVGCFRRLCRQQGGGRRSARFVSILTAW